MKVCLFVYSEVTGVFTEQQRHTLIVFKFYCFRFKVNVGLVYILIIFIILYFPLSCWPEYALLKTVICCC